MTLSKKKIIFVTATRADFGKLKSLIKILKDRKEFEIFIVVTGMHLSHRYGYTYLEVKKVFKTKIIKFKNQSLEDRLETILSKTSENFSKIVKKINPDLIIIHGDRVESLACGIVGSLNHILTGHIEGGELSGTIDDTIRHAVTKLSHVHFVGTNNAKKRIKNMGEIGEHIFNIGSPDIDIIVKEKLPNLPTVRKRYDIKFQDYAIFLWHPVTSRVNNLKYETTKVLNFLKNLEEKFIVIFPNNDPGSKIITECYKQLPKNNFKTLKSLRFEHFLTLLKYAKYIIGNSSAAIYEAPILSTPAINIGERQHKRIKSKVIKNFDVESLNKKRLYNFLDKYQTSKKKYFGGGDSSKKFLKILLKKSFWKIPTQKFFSEN